MKIKLLEYQHFFITFCIGCTLSLLLFSYQNKHQHHYETELFKQYANAQFITLEQKLAASASALKELSVFLKSKNVKPDEFKLFTAELLQHYPEISTLEWIATEPVNNADDTQKLMATEVSTSFKDFTAPLHQKVITANLGFDYFPQVYAALAAREEIKSSVQDFSHAWLKLLNKVNDEHIMTLISPDFVTAETDILPVIVSFYPSHASLIAKQNPSNQADFLAYIFMLLKKDSFTQDAITFAAHNLSSKMHPANQWLVANQDTKTETHYLESLVNINGNSWLLSASAPAHFLKHNNQGVLIGGLLSSLFFALYVHSLQQKYRSVENKIKRQTKQLLSNRACYRAVFNTTVDGIFSMNESGIISHFNKSASKIFGYSAKEVIGRNISMLLADEPAIHHDSYIKNHLQTGSKNVIDDYREICGLHKRGHSIPIQLSLSDTGTEGDMRFTGIIRDLSELKSKEQKLQQHKSHVKQHIKRHTEKLKKENKQLKKLSEIDPLTMIPNRRAYENCLMQEITSAKRTAQPLALLMIDIDHFKGYNDIYGHAAGDLALQLVAQTIAKVLPRQTDLVARFGGEEFVVLLPATNTQGAYLVAENIRKTIQALNIKHQCSIAANVLTLSIGISSLQGHDLNDIDLFEHADTALYGAKNKSRNHCEIYRPKVQLKLIQHQV